MHKKSILIVVALTFLAFGNSLFNGFVQDDQLLFEHNTFYKSLDNLPRLFDQSYIAKENMVLSVGLDEDLGSGAVSYRPWVSFTFFLDAWIWQENPFGYHLHNLLLHVANCILAYFLLFTITRNLNVSLLASLLFAVHPVQAEAVCNIGFRSDLSAFFWGMVAFLSFRKYVSTSGSKRKVFYLGSLLAYLLALFSKESVIILPVLFLIYDFSLRNIRKIGIYHAGFFICTFLYIFLYVFIFPNSALASQSLLGGHWHLRIGTMLKIFLNYIGALVLPFTVHPLPTRYAPDVSHFWSGSILLSITVLLGSLWLMIKMRRSSPQLFFFLSWFMIGLLPVSNLIPLANPMAYRFLYFPALGFFCAVGFWVGQLDLPQYRIPSLPDLGKITKGFLVAICVVVTMGLNGVWKNDVALALDRIQNYPYNPQGYFLLGGQYLEAQAYQEAIHYFEKALERGFEDPRLYYALGVAYHKEDFQRMGEYLEKAWTLEPSYPLPYFALGHEYLQRQEYQKAIPYLEKTIELAPRYARAYQDLLQVYQHLKETSQAEKVIKKARQHIRDQETLNRLLTLVGG